MLVRLASGRKRNIPGERVGDERLSSGTVPQCRRVEKWKGNNMVAVSGSPPAKTTTSASPAQDTNPTAPTDAAKQDWAAAMARAAANASRPVTVKAGQTLSGIAAAHGDSLPSVQNANPQIPYDPYPYKNLIFPNQTVDLPQRTPAEVVPPIDNSQIRPIIYALGNAQAYDKAQDTAALDKVPYGAVAPGQYAALAQSAKNWDAVRQQTYNALIGSNHGLFPNQAAATEIKGLNALEPGNTQFASETGAARSEADRQWQQNGIIAYSNYVQTVQQVHQSLANPSLPHNRAIVSDLNSEVTQAQTTFYTTVENALNNAANGAGSNPVARYDAVNARAAYIESLGPSGQMAPAFKAAVQAAQSDYQVLKPAAAIAQAYANGGAAAGSASLARATQDAGNPGVALQIIEASKPTINNITAEMGTMARQGASINQIYGDLSRSVNAATTLNIPLEDLLDPYAATTLNTPPKDFSKPPSGLQITLSATGQQAAKIIGDSIAANAPVLPRRPRNLPSVSTAYQNAAADAIAKGDGTGLTLATAAALKNNGNLRLASYLVEGAAQGLQGLEHRTDSDVRSLASTTEPLHQLQTTWGPFMTQNDMEKATNGWLKDNPDAVRQIKTEMAAISKDGDAIVEAESAWNTYDTQLGGITGDNDVAHAATQSLPGDNAATYAVSQSNTLSSGIANTLFPVVAQGNNAQSAQSLLGQIIHWPGYTNVSSDLSSFRRALSAWNKNKQTGGAMSGGEATTSGLGSERVTVSLSAAGLVLSLWNGAILASSQKISFTNPVKDVKDFYQQSLQQQAYNIYTGLGMTKYSGEIYSILGKDQKEGAFQLYDGWQPKSNFLKNFLGANADAMKSSPAFKLLGVAYYGAGAVASTIQTIDAFNGPNSNHVLGVLSGVQDLGNIGNAAKPLAELLPVEAGADVLEDIATASSVVGLVATAGLIGYQLYQGISRNDANIAANAKFLEQGLGLNPDLAHALAAPAGVYPSLLPALKQYATANGMTPGQLLLKMNHFANLNRGYLSNIDQFIYQAGRMPMQSDGKFASSAPGDGGNAAVSKMWIEGTDGQAELVPQPLPAESLNQLKHWAQVLFGNQLG
jgi:hypothetical protein